MARFFRMLLAVLAGLVAGSAINMGLILAGGQFIAPPAGADTTTMAGLKASLPLFEARHFLFPFLAHALGTLAGALVAGLLAPERSGLPVWVVGGCFLLGGLANILMLPSPRWFSAADLLLAYVPMAWLGQRLAAQTHQARSAR